jgi:hypothetical protein
MQSWSGFFTDVRQARPRDFRAPLAVGVRLFCLIPALVLPVLLTAIIRDGRAAVIFQWGFLGMLCIGLPFATFAVAGYVPGWMMLGVSISVAVASRLAGSIAVVLPALAAWLWWNVAMGGEVVVALGVVTSAGLLTLAWDWRSPEHRLRSTVLVVRLLWVAGTFLQWRGTILIAENSAFLFLFLSVVMVMGGPQRASTSTPGSPEPAPA